MKIHLSSALFLVLLPALSTATAAADIRSDSDTGATLPRGSYGLDSRYADSDSFSKNAAKGSLDVPVDGKDGRPHAGPWVETSAERDRKSSKGSDDMDGVAGKFDTAIPSSGHLSIEDGNVIPISNDGVMDDPRRTSPKEGTRGTEGGVSEKGKETLYRAEKVPGIPKEAPPLPQSETQKLSSAKDKTAGSISRTADDTSSLGMLEVRLLWNDGGGAFMLMLHSSRNLPTCLTSPTISHIPSRRLRPRIIRWQLNMDLSARAHMLPHPPTIRQRQ